MNNGTNQFNRRLVILGLFFVVFLFSIGLYTARGNRFAAPTATAPFRPPLTNPEIMQNWLPGGSYTYAIARIDDYLQENDLAATSMRAADNVRPSSGAYDFAVTIQPQHQELDVSITITNYGSSSSPGTAVAINGQLQTPLVPGQNQHAASGAPNYSGFDALVSAGVTALQANELQQAVQKFIPSAANVTIDTTAINSTPSADSSEVSFAFPLTIDGRKYSAEFKVIGLTRSQLVLKEANSSKRVFDSGVMSQGV